jgi:hypothetical protein
MVQNKAPAEMVNANAKAKSQECENWPMSRVAPKNDIAVNKPHKPKAMRETRLP